MNSTLAEDLLQELERALRAQSQAQWNADKDSDPLARHVESILETGSAPNASMLFAILGGTREEPDSDPGSLQQSAGIDRRSQAIVVAEALTVFRIKHGFTFKISRDAGVSNQWRRPRIDAEWLTSRRKGDAGALAFFELVEGLRALDRTERAKSAQRLMRHGAEVFADRALRGRLDYPRFKCSPSIAMALVRSFLTSASERPDAMEAIVTVAARTFSEQFGSNPTVIRRDINSPDPIDVLIESAGKVPIGGIEVTDDFIRLAKLQHEVVPAMLSLGLDRATVVSRGVYEPEQTEIESFLNRVLLRFDQRIDLVTIDVIEAWLNFPAADRDVSTNFIWAIADELDEYSSDANRRAWFAVLTSYADSV